MLLELYISSLLLVGLLVGLFVRWSDIIFLVCNYNLPTNRRTGGAIGKLHFQYHNHLSTFAVISVFLYIQFRAVSIYVLFVYIYLK